MINIIKRLLKNENITLEELNQFVTSYVEKTKNKVVTAIELTQIVGMLQNGLFDIKYAAAEYAKILGYQYYTIVDLKTNTIIKADIYEL